MLSKASNYSDALATLQAAAIKSIDVFEANFIKFNSFKTQHMFSRPFKKLV